MKTYRAHKIVQAAQIVSWEGDRAGNGELTGAWFDVVCNDGQTYRMEGLRGAMPDVGLYLVKYEDGYLSISPKKAFEEGYAEIPQGTSNAI